MIAYLKENNTHFNASKEIDAHHDHFLGTMLDDFWLRKQDKPRLYIQYIISFKIKDMNIIAYLKTRKTLKYNTIYIILKCYSIKNTNLIDYYQTLELMIFSWIYLWSKVSCVSSDIKFRIFVIYLRFSVFHENNFMQVGWFGSNRLK